MNNRYQDFLSKLQNAHESERDWLVMEFSLQSLSETLRQAVWAAAIPHWFDRDFLNAVLTDPLKDSDFKTLTELSFVEIYPGRGFNVHERSRKLLLDKLWLDNKAYYQKLSKAAAAYFKKQNQNAIDWRIETLYHGLLANNRTAEESFIKQGLDWFNSFQFDKLEILTQAVLEAVHSGKLTGDIAGYAYDFQADVDRRYYRNESAKKHLELALAQKIKSKALKADCLSDLGALLIHFNEYVQAQDYLQQALVIYQQIKARLGEANVITSLGNVFYWLTEYDQATNYYQQALVIYQQIKVRLGEANCLQHLGTVCLLLNEYNQAGLYYQQALPIYQNIKARLSEANCTRHIGEVHKSLAEYDKAEDSYKQALTIYKEIDSRFGEANCLKCLGELQGLLQQTEIAIATLNRSTQLFEELNDKYSIASCFHELAAIYQRQKQFEPALTAFIQAIDIFPNEVTWYQNRAALYMQIDDYENAEADIKQAETIGTESAITLIRKAELALWQQQSSQAVELCQQALAGRPADGYFRAMLASMLLANGQAQLAYTEMEQALSAIYEKHIFDNLLGVLNKLTRIYGLSAEVEYLRRQILTNCQK
jgi:tetratricopeptide (TPR) repeat protein